MRIVFVNQFFWPDLAATGLLLTDLTRRLVEDGHEVTVICGSSTYAVADKQEAPAVKVLRARNLSFGRGKIVRLLSYASFYLSAAWQLLRTSRPDVVVSMTTPPMVSVLGDFFARIKGCRHYIWEMDLYPDVAVDLKVLGRDSLVTKLIGLIVDPGRRRADGVIALGECMKRRLIDRGVSGEKILIAPNWADGNVIQPPQSKPASERLTLIYTGNLGLAHDIDTVFGALERLDSSGRFRFVFVGGGPRAKELEILCSRAGIKSAEFYSFRSREELTELCAAADIGLVTQRNECTGSLVPSKIYAVLAAGLPLLFIGSRNSTPGLLLSDFECGWRIDVGDSTYLTKLLQELEQDRELVMKKGALAREVFLQYFDRPIATARISQMLSARQVEPVGALAMSKS